MQLRHSTAFQHHATQAGAHIDARAPTTHETPLLIAACNGHADVIRLLLQRGANVHLADWAGHTPLQRVQDSLAEGPQQAEAIRRACGRAWHVPCSLALCFCFRLASLLSCFLAHSGGCLGPAGSRVALAVLGQKLRLGCALSKRTHTRLPPPPQADPGSTGGQQAPDAASQEA